VCTGGGGGVRFHRWSGCLWIGVLVVAGVVVSVQFGVGVVTSVLLSSGGVVGVVVVVSVNFGVGWCCSVIAVGVGGGVGCVVAIGVGCSAGCVELVGDAMIGKWVVVGVGFVETWVWCHQRLLKFLVRPGAGFYRAKFWYQLLTRLPWS
jgi:hypothetical protein